ncbi:MAG: AAA family ATPase, partial [Planctomycetota bacterium]
QFEFIHGPLFANIVLADEINRTPPKTQAALLQAMQEHSVTTRGRTYELPDPFFVLATQNPIEQEGTYSLPEAQLDRFMFMIVVGYPTREQEKDILKRTTGAAHVGLRRIFSGEELRHLQDLVRRVPVPEQVYDHVVDLVGGTRPGQAEVPDVTEWIEWGAGPRAGQMLILGAKARALLHGRFHVARADVDALALPVLRHRLVVGFAGQAEGIDSATLVRRLLAHAGPER